MSMTVDVNDDFSLRASVHAADQPWLPSPQDGVDRRPLDRIGGEVARATSIVRFAPGSSFTSHIHTGGEEYLVLDGVFQDEDGDFPVGTYVRNPPGTRHSPASAPGCEILVKLWQFDPDDRLQVRIDAQDMVFAAEEGEPGVSAALLHEDARETVRMERWAPGASIARRTPAGAEIFVVAGSFLEGGETFRPRSWLRLPKGAILDAVAGAEGATLWTKTGHLSRTPAGPF